MQYFYNNYRISGYYINLCFRRTSAIAATPNPHTNARQLPILVNYTCLLFWIKQCYMHNENNSICNIPNINKKKVIKVMTTENQI